MGKNGDVRKMNCKIFDLSQPKRKRDRLETHMSQSQPSATENDTRDHVLSLLRRSRRVTFWSGEETRR